MWYGGRRQKGKMNVKVASRWKALLNRTQRTRTREVEMREVETGARVPRDDVNQQGPTHLILELLLVRDFRHVKPLICLLVVVPKSELETYPNE